ncbi:MAG: ABC transporter permease subunit [Candidatus Cloacimonadales bacterium]|nr:ABC transporter permease subunit [Candidatus Cloacimonadales bacterium]
MNLNKASILGFFIVLIFLLLLAVSLEINFSDFFSLKISFRTILIDLSFSFLRVSITTIVAWLVGIVCGYLLYYSKFFLRLFLPLINFIRHISPFAWLPFAILWFGLGEGSVTFIMFITLFFPTLIAASELFSSIPHEYLDEANVSGASRFQIIRFVLIPLNLIGFINLFRIIWGLGWSVIIAAEMLGVNSGLGFRLLDFRYLLQYPQMLLYFVIMGCFGILIDAFLKKTVDFLKDKFS